MNDSDLIHRLISDPAIFGDEPILRGRRLAVEHVLPIRVAAES